MILHALIDAVLLVIFIPKINISECTRLVHVADISSSCIRRTKYLVVVCSTPRAPLANQTIKALVRALGSSVDLFKTLYAAFMAIALADSMNEALDEAYSYKYDRSQERKKRDKYEIGIQAVRGGNIVGEHEVIFAGTDEVITFKHTAYSKAIFGKGAIEAAKYLAGKPAGFYGMADVIKSAS